MAGKSAATNVAKLPEKKRESKNQWADESKEAKFRRIGRKRFILTVNRIRQLMNLTNRSSYNYDAEQVETLIGSLRDEVDALDTAFQAGLRKGNKEVAIDL